MPSIEKLSYYLHYTTYILYTHIHTFLKIPNLKMASNNNLGRGPEMSPDHTPLQVTTLQDILITLPTLSLSISATFSAFGQISPMWSITSPPLNLTFFSSLKFSFLTATFILSPPFLAFFYLNYFSVLTFIIPPLFFPSFH